MSEAPRELFLIDGNSLAYRAFYALPEPIATSRGFPTNAIFGFASMLVKILTDYGPKATLVVWDAGMSGRGEMSEDYKAGRRERPDLLSEQWPHLQPLVEAFGYRNVKAPGYEADDVISSLALRAKGKGIDVMVVTGDRDMFQIVQPGIRVMATSRGITETKIYDREAVIERYGIPPEAIPDFYGLKGDTSDNIPGVPGIGDKTASQLLQEYGDLERVLANIDSISGAKRKEKARTIVPSELTELEGELLTLAAERPTPDEPDQGELLAPPPEPLRFAAYAGDDEVIVGEAETLAAITMAWGDKPVVAHDWKSIASSEEPCDAPPLEHDTMVAAYLLDPAGRAYPLLELTERDGIGARVDGANGLAERAVLTRALAERQREEMEEQGLTELFRDVELPLVDVLVDLERAGVKLDVPAVREISAKVQDTIRSLEREIWDMAGEEFTIGSPQQLAEVLFNKLGLSKKRRGKTGFSTDARVLQAIRSEHPIVEKIESWREYSKLKSTYLDAFPLLVDERSRLHTTFNQTATTTGRLSSTDPNLQNIPIRTELGREIRACFVAEEGHKLISADYSQVELRVLAHISGEAVLKEIFEAGEDVHTATAGEMFGVTPDQVDPGLRSKAKMINFGIVYGRSAYGLADRLDIPPG